jgi:hypothetical protein
VRIPKRDDRSTAIMLNFADHGGNQFGRLLQEPSALAIPSWLPINHTLLIIYSEIKRIVSARWEC